MSVYTLIVISGILIADSDLESKKNSQYDMFLHKLKRSLAKIANNICKLLEKSWPI